MLPEELNTSTETPRISFGDVSLRMHQPLLPKPLAKNAMLIHVRGDIVGQNNGVTVVSRRGTSALFVGKCPLSARSGQSKFQPMPVNEQVNRACSFRFNSDKFLVKALLGQWQVILSCERSPLPHSISLFSHSFLQK